MLLPLGTDRPLRRPTKVTYALVMINVAIGVGVFTVAKVSPTDAGRLYDWLMLDPRRLNPFTFISYAFLHADWMHLLGNMLALWVFGPNVEDRLGRAGFSVLYFVGAVVAGAAHCVTTNAPVIGASGAIAAVTGAYIVLFPRTNIKTIFLVFFSIFWVPAVWFIGFSIFKDLFWLAASTSIIGSGSGRAVDDAVARTAHLGGYALGAGASLILLWTGLLKREVYDLFSIGKQAMRRRQLRELAARAPSGPIGPKALEVTERVRKNAAAASDARMEALARARSAVVTELSAGRHADAIAKYRALLGEFGDIDTAAVLARRPMGDLANALFLARDHTTAATAYEALLTAYPRDPDVPRIKLMLGLINARYLNDPVRAKAVLAGLDVQLAAEDERRQARELLADLA